MKVVDRGKYNMAIYEQKRQVHVQILGFIKDDMVPMYLQDLQETVSKTSKTNYTFVVDATYQSPLPRKTAAGLGGTFMFYVEQGFKHVYIVKPKSKIAAVQIRNAVETVPFPGSVVDNVATIPNHM